ncbi:MAG: alkaline phosphatase D family protein [Deltaproteobacteria bacterium]|nr:alkaline phosphatase D family protein [Deltaproteobacteria bacterium]
MLTRRDWIALVGLGGLGGASLSLGCGDNLARHEWADSATAILEPGSTSFIVSVWARVATSVMIAVRADGALVTLETLALGPSGSGALEVTGLTPDTQYEVVVTTGDGAEPAPMFARTAPRDAELRAVRIAISADVDPNPEFESAIVPALIAERPELFISLGDFPYTDDGPPAQTVDEYRARHVNVRATPRFRDLLGAVGVRAIYDDHEFHNDWDARFVAAEPARYAAAVAVWDEFFPMRTTGEIRYRSWRWGAHLECFLLDCRRFRSANAAPDDPRKTMLGAAQLRWLLDGLRASTATFKLVLSSVPLDFGFGDDHWPAFGVERQTIFDAVVGVPGVVFASADQHWFAAHRHAFGIREFQVGPLARGIGAPPPAVDGVVFRHPAYNFATFEASADALIVTGVGAGGEHFYKETLTVGDLTPAHTR